MAIFGVMALSFVAPPDPSGGLARTPPMGWMSWQVFRCETDCKKEPNACINEDLCAAQIHRAIHDARAILRRAPATAII